MFLGKLMTSCLGGDRTTTSYKSSCGDREISSLKNGGLLVEELIRISNGDYNPFRVFSEHDLKQATKDYDQDHVLLLDDNYRLFQGDLENRGIVLIKKTDDHDELVEYCIREIAIAAYVSTNTNLVKLLGCCLESKIPIIVFEYVPKGNLSAYLQEEKVILPWRCRINRIAAQVAAAIVYLHVGKSRPLIHRHVKTGNILLDADLNAKLFDFGLSLESPLGETYVQALVEGTIGFIAPESVNTGKFNEKTDVFAFGATLIEILTGREPHDVFIEASRDLFPSLTPAAESSLLMPVPLPTRRDLLVFLKSNLIKYAKKNALEASAELAARCVDVLPEKRPTIEEVAKELRHIQNM
ncbi:PREDICTED: putative wall-associated receptor kinase-like 16 [Camelina sativa]|uniref:Wall-associated receptor kinase-like 16 n=1 Tax=Camelina sativa TaxID=90675 RepID=A0ABM0TUG7_CAMSA|nr:PREDICTED: putative wall-associated receptor kinase-like 16 [Camelina sativa]